MIVDNLYYVPEEIYRNAQANADRLRERIAIGISYSGSYNPALTIAQNADRYRADLRVGRFCRWTLPAEEERELMAKIHVGPMESAQ